MAKTIKKAPASDSPQAGAINKRQLLNKDTENYLPKQQRRVLTFLEQAKRPRSAADIAKALGQCDPRGHIAQLRRKGYSIGDVWCISSDGNRYKRYFLRKEVENGR